MKDRTVIYGEMAKDPLVQAGVDVIRQSRTHDADQPGAVVDGTGDTAWLNAPLDARLQVLDAQRARKIVATGKQLVEMFQKMNKEDATVLLQTAANVTGRFGGASLIAFEYKGGLFEASADRIIQCHRATVARPGRDPKKQRPSASRKK